MTTKKGGARKAISWLVGGSLFLLALMAASPSGLLANLRQFSLNAAAVVLGLASLNVLAVAFRFWRMLSHCGVGIPWRPALRACLAGNLASLAFIPLLAQVAGRQSILSRYGLSAVATASVSAYERMLLAVVSSSAATLAGIFLIGFSAVGELAEQLALTQVVIVIIAASTIGYALGRTPMESELMHMLTRRNSVLALAETTAITVVGQGLMVVAFAIAFHWAGPSLTWPQLIACGAIVSFAASIPLSVGGWGIREVASVFVLGQLGVGAADAMAASVMVGVCSTLAVFLTSPLSLALKSASGGGAARTNREAQTMKLDGVASWLLGMGTVVLVFFQVHVPLRGTVVNLNLGDPLALLAFAAVSLTLVQARSLPQWRLPGLNAWLALFTAALLAAFATGVHNFGVTPWALGNKLMGWLVLLGYLSAGYLLATQRHHAVIKRVTEAALALVFVIVWLKLAIRLTPWLPGMAALEAPNFEGFSGNRNAFAFQLCAVLALTLGYLGPYARMHRGRLVPFGAMVIAVATLLLGIALSASRTGIAVTVILLLLSFVSQRGSRRLLVVSIVLAAVFWLLCTVDFSNWTLDPHGSALGSLRIQSAISTQESDTHRWHANIAGLKMWMESPWLGTGLGGFLHQSEARFGFPLIIHNTPIWLLTEFGLMGIAVVAFGLLIVVRHLSQLHLSRLAAQDKAWVLLLICFALFCQLHEMLYQRTLWLFMGVLLAAPFATSRTPPAGKSESSAY
jgi:uncharacterized membrane protein YbhN (UPF0104 family)